MSKTFGNAKQTKQQSLKNKHSFGISRNVTNDDSGLRSVNTSSPSQTGQLHYVMQPKPKQNRHKNTPAAFSPIVYIYSINQRNKSKISKNCTCMSHREERVRDKREKKIEKAFVVVASGGNWLFR
jgi:hypothetical protein